MLTLTFLGVGSAFAKRNFHSNALVEAWSKGPEFQERPDATLLIDFGATGPLALHQLMGRPGFQYLDHAGVIDYSAIERIFVTHLHGDHIGGLEEFASCTFFARHLGRKESGRRATLNSGRGVLDCLWDHSLKGGLGVLDGRAAMLEDYFIPKALDPTGAAGADRFVMAERYEFVPFPTDHIRISHKYDWPSFGLLIRDQRTGETAFYSGDTRFDPEGLESKMASARTIFHDVQLEDTPLSVHALLSELQGLSPEIRKRMVLYHYADQWDGAEYAGVANEFAGFAHPQHRYVLFP